MPDKIKWGEMKLPSRPNSKNNTTTSEKELQVGDQKLPIPSIPSEWDYDTSVGKTKQLIYKWKNITYELARELYIAREKLSQKREGKKSEQ